MGEGSFPVGSISSYKIIPCCIRKRYLWINTDSTPFKGDCRCEQVSLVSTTKLLTKTIRSLKLKAALLWIPPSIDLCGVTTQKLSNL